MRRRCSSFACGLALALLGATVRAAEAPAPNPEIRTFSLTTIEALGLEIYRQDAAAWVASDVLVAQMKSPATEHIVGWIVVPHGADERVRFLRDQGGGLEAAYDIDVDASRHGQLSEPVERRLTREETAAFVARQTAAHNLLGACRPGYNSVVIRDPEGDGWLVWMLAPMPALGSIPFGGHYRFTVSADGKTVLRRDALSASCMTMAAPKSVPGAQPAIAVVTHVVSPTPVETHVFLQLQAKTPFLVLAGAEEWVIDGGKIKDLGKIADLTKSSRSPAP